MLRFGNHLSLWLLFSSFLPPCLAAPPVAARHSLELEKVIALPEVKGGFDLMALDVAGQRLFVAGQDNNTLEILDLKAGKPLASVPGLKQPKGVLYLPDLHRIYVSNKDDGSCRIFDSESYRPIGRVDFPSKANNLRYDARRKTIYVGYGDGAIGTIRVADNSRGPDVALASYPKQFQLEQNGNRIFVNVPVPNHVAVIDRERMKLIALWPIREEKANVPMALDEQQHRLFVGCEPGKFVVIDAQTGRSVALLPINTESDGIQYDAKRHRIYVSCNGGSIDVIRQTDADHYQFLDRIVTEKGAGTSLLAPDADHLYLAAPKTGTQAAQIQVYRVCDTDK